MLLVEPQRVLSPARSSWLDRHLDRLCRLLELTPAQFEDAEKKYRAVGNWLSDSGSLLAIYAHENGQGMMFPAENQPPPTTSPAADDSAAKKGSHLRVIK